MANGEPNSSSMGRVLLKISGEALGDRGISAERIGTLAGDLVKAADTGCGIGIVLGGGNILRGRDLSVPSIRRPVRDRMGMLATVINALAMADALVDAGRPAKVLTATTMPGVAEMFRMERARELIDAGTVVLLAGGTGHPYFTTDTAAALRALEIGADALLKATKVDGVYSADPVDNPDAVRYDSIGYDEVIRMGLGVMDLTAITLCKENRLPVRVFDITIPGNLLRVIGGEPVGTLVEKIMYDEILLEIEMRMEKAVEHLSIEYRGIRSGRATPGLVENIRVEYYGSMQPLKACASIAIPEPRLVVIKPFDPGSAKTIEKAIQTSDLGIPPQSDGKLIRLEIPPLSEERRHQLAGLVKEKAEDARVAIRNIRRDGNKQAEQAEKDKNLSEDQRDDLKGDIQDLTKQYEEKVEDIVKRKTEEILEV